MAVDRVAMRFACRLDYKLEIRLSYIWQGILLQRSCPSKPNPWHCSAVGSDWNQAGLSVFPDLPKQLGDYFSDQILGY